MEQSRGVGCDRVESRPDPDELDAFIVEGVSEALVSAWIPVAFTPLTALGCAVIELNPAHLSEFGRFLYLMGFLVIWVGVAMAWVAGAESRWDVRVRRTSIQIRNHNRNKKWGSTPWSGALTDLERVGPRTVAFEGVEVVLRDERTTDALFVELARREERRGDVREVDAALVDVLRSRRSVAPRAGPHHA